MMPLFKDTDDRTRRNFNQLTVERLNSDLKPIWLLVPLNITQLKCNLGAPLHYQH